MAGCTPRVTVASASVISVVCGSSASTRQPALGHLVLKMMHALSAANIELDRKVLAELAISDPAAFRAVRRRPVSSLLRLRPSPALPSSQ